MMKYESRRMPRSIYRTIALIAALCMGMATWQGARAGQVHVQVNDTAGRPLADAVVFLESREARQMVRAQAGAEMAQVNKQFLPRVLPVPVGTAVSFPNRDTVRHHVYSFSSTKTFEIKLYTGTTASPVVFDKPGIAVLGCNIHDNMAAWIVVVETPHFARTERVGMASMRDVPPGVYRLRVWHPGMAVGAPATDQPLNVGAADTSLTVALSGVGP